MFGEDEDGSQSGENPLDGPDEGGSILGETTPAEQELVPQAPEITDPSERLEDNLPDLEGNIENIDSNTQSAFVVCVALTNVAVFGVSAGILIGLGRSWGRLAIGLLVIGIITGVRSYQHYRKWENNRDNDSPGSAE